MSSTVSNIQTLRQDVGRLVESLAQSPVGLKDVRRISRQLRQVVGHFEALNQQINRKR